MQYESLYHHGIKGQRWGVRRYQNADGSLTAAGRKRVKQLENKIEKIKSADGSGTNDQIKDKATVSIGNSASKAVDTARKTARDLGLTNKDDILNRGTAKQIKKLDLENIDTEKLRQSYNRLDVQQKVRQISDADLKAKIDKGLNIFNSVATGVEIGSKFVATGSSLYNGVAKINNSLNPNMKMPTLDGGARLAAKKMMQVSDEDFFKEVSLGNLDMGEIKAYSEIAKTLNNIRKNQKKESST